MKNVEINFKKYVLYLGVFFMAFGFYSCSDDDDDPGVATPTGSIVVEDQTISQNQIMIDQVSSTTDGFIIARHNTSTGSILAQESINEGTDDLTLQLDDEGTGVDLQDGDTVVLTLYADTNNNGTFDSETDAQMATENVMISSPNFSITDQQVMDNTVTYDNVSVSRDSWLAVYGENDQGEIDENNILGRTFVEAGDHQDVVLTFDEGQAPQAGAGYHTQIHRDDPADANFGYPDDPTTDVPEEFGFNPDPLERRITWRSTAL